MTTPETFSDIGVTYMAYVDIGLPPQSVVAEAAGKLKEHDESEDYTTITPGVPVTLRNPHAGIIDYVTDPMVVYQDKEFAVLQLYIGEKETGFDELFNPDIEDGRIGLHQVNENDAGFLVAPATSYDRLGKPLRGMAVLCLGTEAVDFIVRPDREQIESWLIAAKIALANR